MRGIIASCALSALLLAAAWAEHHQHHKDNHSHDAEMTCLKLSPPNADFAFALYKSLLSQTAAGKNIFFSPLGISSALSMLSTGARGETQKQLFSTLGYSEHSQKDINEAYLHLFHMIQHGQKDQELYLGNAAAVRSGFNPLNEFTMAVENYFSGKIFNFDFSKPEEAAAEINSYVAGKTHNMIKDQVKDLNPEMAMVLINYIYFNGEWEKHFNANLTEKADFHVDETTKVEVDMMKRRGRFDFYEDFDNHTNVILLPYKGNTSMMIILPDEGKMKEVEDYINKDYIKHWHDSLFRTSVDLYLPKFQIGAEASLESSLKEMGITDAFENNADFSGMSEEVMLKVSKVSHKAVLSVFETGTRASAVTTLELMPMSLPAMMILNRPFLLLIVEDSTRSILFMGKINNPNAM